MGGAYDTKWQPSARSRWSNRIGYIISRHRLLTAIFVVLCVISLFTGLPFYSHFHWGGGRIVLILAANEGGGVMHWKGAKEWSVERSSIANKKDFCNQHGYHLAIKDVSAKRRYAHEWRESWQKVDLIRQTMRQFPNAEWFWWLDLHTYIMEPQLSLEKQVLKYVKTNTTVRDLSTGFNPLGIESDIPYIDLNQPVDLVLGQDCGGFNLGSFMIRRSDWSEKLLDLWWDPVFYEQKHMDWEHNEQDSLEYLYRNHAWVRSRVGFIPLRKINAFPPGACAEQADDPQFFYNERDRDFVVNMAGCQYGRDCWAEMEHYKALSKKLHKKKFWLF